MKAGIITPVRGGVIRAVTSGAEVHRALICASLADKETYIECFDTSENIYAVVENLNNTGAKIRYDGCGFEVKPVDIPPSKGVVNPFTVMKRSEEIRLSGDNAYQSMSGLLPALALLDTDSVIIVEGREELSSKSNMTIETMGLFGVQARRESRNDGAVYKIPGRQRYISPGSIKINGDWTSAAIWLCAAAIGGDGVICSNLSRFSQQSDKEIVDILERFGAIVAYKGDSVAVRHSNLRSIRINAAEIPDLIPVLAVVAAVTPGQSVLYNAGKVPLIENGMLQKISETLNALGADVADINDGLLIQGKQVLKGGTVSSQGNHQIAMMAALASAVCEDTVAIKEAEAVNKTYPAFFEDFEKLGGKVVYNMGG